MFDNEEWRTVSDLPHYQISNLGRVKHVDRAEARQITINDRGFPVVVLYGRDKKTRYLRQINMLVAKAFLHPARFEDETAVWHIDGDLLNCNAENLRWEMRSRVLEWNDMHRTLQPKLKTPRVKNNRTGVIYENAFECGVVEGMLESAVVARIERQARHTEDDNARYRYIYRGQE